MGEKRRKTKKEREREREAIFTQGETLTIHMDQSGSPCINGLSAEFQTLLWRAELRPAGKSENRQRIELSALLQLHFRRGPTCERRSAELPLFTMNKNMRVCRGPHPPSLSPSPSCGILCLHKSINL